MGHSCKSPENAANDLKSLTNREYGQTKVCNVPRQHP
jgi:hypothetical protein